MSEVNIAKHVRTFFLPLFTGFFRLHFGYLKSSVR